MAWKSPSRPGSAASHTAKPSRLASSPVLGPMQAALGLLGVFKA